MSSNDRSAVKLQSNGSRTAVESQSNRSRIVLATTTLALQMHALTKTNETVGALKSPKFGFLEPHPLRFGPRSTPKLAPP